MASITGEITVDHDSLDFDVSPRRAEEMLDIGYDAARRQLTSNPVLG